eukprot:6181064-Pleurochrysis_carterae.AAC.1
MQTGISYLGCGVRSANSPCASTESKYNPRINSRIDHVSIQAIILTDHSLHPASRASPAKWWASREGTSPTRSRIPQIPSNGCQEG